MTPPRVSWLMPVYNGEEFLPQALDSILAQTFEDFEVIVVNDGSTDGTADILRSYAEGDARFTVLHQANGGIVSALNRGFQVCRGEYIARMEADDVSLPERLEKQVSYLDGHPECALVGGLAITEHEDGRLSREFPNRHRETNVAAFPARIKVSHHPLVTMRRSALEAIGGYRGDFPHAEDYDMFIRLAREGP